MMKPPAHLLMLAFLLGAALRTGAQPAEPQAVDPTAVQRTVEQLREGDWILQWQAMRKLAQWQESSAIAPLMQILRSDASPWLRGRALVALAQIRGRAVASEANRYLDDSDPHLRAAAVEAVGIIGDPRSERRLLSVLKDDTDSAVKAKAIEAYARVAGDEAWVFVRGGLGDKDELVAYHAARSLVYVPREQAATTVLEMLGAEEDVALQRGAEAAGLLQLAEAATPLLTLAATHGKSEVRQAAGAALEQYPMDLLEPPLVKALTGGDSELAGAAMRQLRTRSANGAPDQLGEHLLRVPLEQTAATTALIVDYLAETGAQPYVPALRRMLGSPAVEVRRAAAAGLGRVAGIDLYEALRPVIADPEASVRSAALQVLADADAAPPDGTILAYIAPAVKPGEPLPAQSALVRLIDRHAGPADYERALALLSPVLADESNHTHRQQAAEALRKLGGEEVVPDLTRRQGFVSPWQIVGPFPAGAENQPDPNASSPPNFDRTYPVGDTTRRWQTVASQTLEGHIDPEAATEPAERGERFYAVAVVETPEEREGELYFETRTESEVYLNGEQIISRDGGSESSQVRFPAGRSVIFVRLTDDGGDAVFRVRLKSPDQSTLSAAKQVTPGE